MTSYLLITVVLGAVAPGEPAKVAIVALDAEKRTTAAADHLIQYHGAKGIPVLAPDEAAWRLTGLRQLHDVNVEQLSAHLTTARNLWAEFKTEEATAERHKILRAYENARTVTPELSAVMGQAMHDLAAAAMSDGKSETAKQMSFEAQRRFPDVPLEPTLHPPSVYELYQQVAATLARAPEAQLTVTSDMPGDVFADGLYVGRIRGTLRKFVPVGPYRVYIRGEHGTTLPHEVRVGEMGESVHFSTLTSNEVSFDPVLTLRCKERCPERMRVLGKELHVKRVVGVEPFLRIASATTLEVDVATGDSSEEDLPEEVQVASTTLRPHGNGDSNAFAGTDADSDGFAVDGPRRTLHFSVWSLVPFGVGQYKQDRTIAGTVWLAGEVGLTVWHAIALSRDLSAGPDDDWEALRSQRNLSAYVLIGALVAGVAEAVIVGALQDG